MAHASYPIPFDDIEYTAKYAYNWRSAVNDIKDHQSHAFITIMPGGNDQVKRFRIFTKVASSLLGATNSIGIYMGNQTLLLPTEGYIEEVRSMDNDSLPINLWIYIGLRENKSNSGRVYGSGYTYGLKEFNKSEIEIVHSTKDIVEIRDLLYDIVHYVLKNDVTLNDGDTGGHTEEEKIKITYSQGVFVDDMTFKIEY
ncbi:MAG: DUF4261 domain-containing protein [Chitinophagales bacterium]|nr:DUF4261 domain-containing protein [Chitinophagaceae bacterium]MCB9065582.1 DUF4261 domain-containing protein [Chitinophagales bacterium]